MVRPGTLRNAARAAASAALVMVVIAGCTGTADRPQGIELGRIAGDPTEWKQVPAQEMALPTELSPLTSDKDQQINGSRPVLVNFWASWCSACKQELPWLQRLSEQGHVTVVGVTRDRYAKYASGSLTKANATYPNRMDPDGDYLRRYRGLLPIGLPHSALIVDGEVRAVHIGPFTSWRELRRGATTLGS